MQKFFFLFICVFLRSFFSANTQKTIKANKRLQQFIGQNQESKETLKEHEQEIIINFPPYDDNCCNIFCICETLVFFYYFRSCLNELQNIPLLSLRNSLLKCNL